MTDRPASQLAVLAEVDKLKLVQRRTGVMGESRAERPFGLLPEDQRARYRALWDEFEARETPEALFANALDRFQGLLQNVHNNGGTWKKYEISRDRILERMDPIREGAPALWPWVRRMVDGVMGWG